MTPDRYEWYYMGESGQIGPLNDSQILELADHAAITHQTLVWKVGMEGWVPAGSIPVIAARMKPVHSPPAVATPPPSPKASALAVCPRDGATLKRETRTGVEIDWCPTCRGVWLDRGELEKLLDRGHEDHRRYESRGHEDRYDDDDHSRRKGKRRGGFLDDVFDIFD